MSIKILNMLFIHFMSFELIKVAQKRLVFWNLFRCSYK